MNSIISILTIDTDTNRESDSTLKGNQILTKVGNVFYCLRQQVIVLCTFRRHSPTLKLDYFKKPKNQATHLAHKS